MNVKKILCMVCDFEGKVSFHDPIFNITHCPSCGEELEYDDGEDYNEDELDLQ